MVATACGGSATTASGKGISKGEILLGGTFPMTGPLASYGALAKGLNAYFQKINTDGGIAGRKLRLITLDDAYDPSRAAANVRELVQQKKVFAVIDFGGAPVVARDYLQQVKVPQFSFAGLTALSDVRAYSFTRSWWPDLGQESRIVARYVAAHQAQASKAHIGTITINNDAGHDYQTGIKASATAGVTALGTAVTYEPTDTDVSSQVNSVRGQDALATLVTGAAEISMIKYVAQTGWTKPLFLYSGASSIASFLKPAGSAAKGVYSALWLKDPADPQWAADPGLRTYRSTIASYGGAARSDDIIVANGYGLGEAFVAALRSARQLTPAGLLNAWDNLPPTTLDVLQPGITIKGDPKTGRPVHSFQIARFDGASWKPQGNTVEAGSGAGS
ncbi:ABC transporter substrate-binding protein [Actinoallomurus acanthiterrae]